MKYKIIADIDISGNGKGDIIEAEPHAVELYLERKQIEEINGQIPKTISKAPVAKKTVVRKPKTRKAKKV